MFFIQEVQDILKKKVRQVVPLTSATAKVATETENYFIKYSPAQETPAFFKEVRGLEAMRKTQTIDVIQVVGVSSRFILLEYLEPHPSPSKTFFQDFGIQLASMHRHPGQYWGFEEDNFLGATPQPNLNPKQLSWPEFFWEKRLRYQCRLGTAQGLIDETLKKRILNLQSVVKELLSTQEQPSLLHGDLWSGNFLINTRGDACLIDPAVYYGHHEAELAMCRLFGGFSADFYRAYEETFPLEQGFQRRFPLYQLYHVLNHLNLFGRSYLGQVESILDQY